MEAMGDTGERGGAQQYRHGPYTQVNPASKKIKPQQARWRLKVQALNQLDAIAEGGLTTINAEVNTMAWAWNQQIWLELDEPHSTRMHCEIVHNHTEPLLMNNQELYWVMVQINLTMNPGPDKHCRLSGGPRVLASATHSNERQSSTAQRWRTTERCHPL